MQSQCPSCSQRIVVDDAKVPDKPFSVKCPKCHTVVRFPGRSSASSPPAPAAPTSSASEALMAELRRQLSELMKGGRAQVLVALGDRAASEAVTGPLTRLGYSVDTLDNPEEGGRFLEQGLYDAVVTDRTSIVPERGETLYQRVTRLHPDARRRIFLVLVGDGYRTGEGTQAWSALADLVVNPAETEGLEKVLINALIERARLYKPFVEARSRFESAAG